MRESSSIRRCNESHPASKKAFTVRIGNSGRDLRFPANNPISRERCSVGANDGSWPAGPPRNHRVAGLAPGISSRSILVQSRLVKPRTARNNRQRRIRACTPRMINHGPGHRVDRIATLAETLPTDKSSALAEWKKIQSRKFRERNNIPRDISNDARASFSATNDGGEGGAFGGFSQRLSLVQDSKHLRERTRVRMKDARRRTCTRACTRSAAIFRTRLARTWRSLTRARRVHSRREDPTRV